MYIRDDYEIFQIFMSLLYNIPQIPFELMTLLYVTAHLFFSPSFMIDAIHLVNVPRIYFHVLNCGKFIFHEIMSLCL